MNRIPIAADVAAAVGTLGERVENRSLLLDKYSFHKSWGLDKDFNAHDARRLSLMRISDDGPVEIHRDADFRRDRANGRDTNPDNRTRLLEEAKLADALASTKCFADDAQELRQKHSRRLVSLVRKAYGKNASIVIGQLEGRLAINLADSLIPNAGISLDRLFGLPYIPGSAVKGICRHGAMELLKQASGTEQIELFIAFQSIFGTASNDFDDDGALCTFRPLVSEATMDRKGAITFLPASPVNESNIVVDLTTVHYPDYYRSGDVEDLSKEKPLPNPFPCVETGAQFAFCLVLNGLAMDPLLLEKATSWLEAALTGHGIGAKTAAGYGWFSIQPTVLQSILEEENKLQKLAVLKAKAEAETKARKDVEAARIASLKPEILAMEAILKLSDNEFAEKAKTILSLPDLEQHGVILALLNTELKSRWKKWRKSDKANDKLRVTSILAVATKFKLVLPQ